MEKNDEEKVVETISSDDSETKEEQKVVSNEVNETISETATNAVTQAQTATQLVASKPIKRRKKDIIGYNPETGEPIYKEYAPGEIPPKKSKKGLIIGIISVLLLAAITVGIIFLLNSGKDDKKEENKPKKKENKTEQKEPKKQDDSSSKYKILSSNIGEYDLYFLKTENNGKNMIYSPLSIKYALAMLNEGTDGESHEQIANVIGEYTPKKYTNSSNMSFANALFINNTYKNNIEKKYSDTLKNKYNAEIIFDDFNGPDNINKWVKEKTLDLIEDLLNELDKDEQFVLVNALGIDMEWNNKFHGEQDWYIKYPHQKFFPDAVDSSSGGYPSMEFNDVKGKSYFGLKFVAIVDNYDIVKTEGEDKIRKTVGEEYKKWLDEGGCGDVESEPPVDTYLDKYLDEIGSRYGKTEKSTDFEIYNDDNVKAFKKELKEYDDTTLEYVAIMPKEEKLKDYINNVKAEDLSKIIGSFKEINNDNYAANKITYIHGTLPMFEYEYELDLINDLTKLGIKDVFTIDADLSKISKKEKLYIDSASHKANIAFSNDGIKAAAATALGGKGAAACYFEYFYEPPVEEIDMTFDKPYLYMIIDKDTNEVWFMGTVYEPKEYKYEY